MAFVNPISAGLRQLTRLTAGKVVHAKVDTYANRQFIEGMLQLRPQSAKALDVPEFCLIGKRYNLDPCALDVLTEIETASEPGFTKEGRLVLNNEPHLFSKSTSHAWDIEAPHLSYPYRISILDAGKLPARWLEQWGAHPYVMGQKNRWTLWQWQAELDPVAAITSTGFGRFHVMGSHWRRLGFTTPAAMMEFAVMSETNQLDLFLRWFGMEDRLDQLRLRDWLAIARSHGASEPEDYAAHASSLYEKRSGLY